MQNATASQKIRRPKKAQKGHSVAAHSDWTTLHGPLPQPGKVHYAALRQSVHPSPTAMAHSATPLVQALGTPKPFTIAHALCAKQQLPCMTPPHALPQQQPMLPQALKHVVSSAPPQAAPLRAPVTQGARVDGNNAAKQPPTDGEASHKKTRVKNGKLDLHKLDGHTSTQVDKATGQLVERTFTVLWEQKRNIDKKDITKGHKVVKVIENEFEVRKEKVILKEAVVERKHIVPEVCRVEIDLSKKNIKKS